MKTVILSLTLLGLALQAAAQAPGDHVSFCRSSPGFVQDHIFPAEWEILVDTYDYFRLLGVWTSISEDGDSLQFTQTIGGLCESIISICAQQPDQENWLISQHIRYGPAKELFFNMTYSLEQCAACTDDFLTMKRLDIDEIDNSQRTSIENYKPMFGTEEASRISATRSETRALVRPSDSEGFYLGLRDEGTCGRVGRMIVYYTVCRERKIGLVEYPKFANPPRNGPNVIFQASCVPNAHNVTSLDVIAESATSTCRDADPQGAKCECDAGYELSQDGTSCERCLAGEFRALDGSPSCQPCPANTVRDVAGAAVCQCLPGMFRSKEEGPADACSAPPSGIRDLELEEAGSTELVISWRRPVTTGNNLFYEIRVSSAAGVSGASSGATVEPFLEDLSSTVTYTVPDLEPFTSYFVTVVTHNAVSDLDLANQALRTQQIVAKTSEGVPGVPFLNRLCTVVIWKAPLIPAGVITGYEVRLGGPSSTNILTFSPTENFYITTGEERTNNALVEIRARNSFAASPWTEPQPLDCSSMNTGCSTNAPPTALPSVVPGIVPNPIVPSLPPCLPLPSPNNGVVLIEQRKALYGCDEGFALTGESARLCRDDGTWEGEAPTCQPTCTSQPLYFTLRGVRFENNSQIPLLSLGEGDNALHAITGDPDCCRVKRLGEFYYPDETLVPINSANQPLYRNRDNGLIRLHRRANSDVSAIPTGRYRSELPDDCGKIVSLYINLV